MTTSIIECLLRQVVEAFDALSEIISAGGGGGGGGIEIISGPVVSTTDDVRGSIGAFSYNPDFNGTPTMFYKVDNSPDTWIFWTVNTTAP